MKKLTVILVMLSTAFIQKAFSQDSIQSQSPTLINRYYDIKNSLVAGDAKATASSAEEFIKLFLKEM